MNPSEALPNLRSNSLAMAFQDAITVILRVRYRVQRVSDIAAFRDSIRKMIAAAVHEARRAGYSDATAQMALYAIIGFLDESVLTSQDLAFADWARRPLQEEMFGGAFAGEYFFRHVNDLLNQQETNEYADALELHALCLLLGYKGKYAFGDRGEIQGITRRVREKIARTRGNLTLFKPREEKPIVAAPAQDVWVKRLVLTTVAVTVITLVAFAAFYLLLSGNLANLQAALSRSASLASISALALGGLAL